MEVFPRRNKVTVPVFARDDYYHGLLALSVIKAQGGTVENISTVHQRHAPEADRLKGGGLRDLEAGAKIME
jgi:hypothetical protein